MVFGFSRKRVIVVRSLLCLLICLLLFKYNTTQAQSIDINLVTLTDLGLTYETESDFETIRTIPNAIKLEIFRARTKLEVEAKIVSTSNFAFLDSYGEIYSLTLKSTNQDLDRKYFKEVTLDYFDETVLVHDPKNNDPTNAFYEFDLNAMPIGYEVEPGGYFYSIVFTVSPK